MAVPEKPCAVRGSPGMPQTCLDSVHASPSPGLLVEKYHHCLISVCRAPLLAPRGERGLLIVPAEGGSTGQPSSALTFVVFLNLTLWRLYRRAFLLGNCAINHW